MAAAAIDLCASRDGGATWDIEQEGLHAAYCSAVAFVGEDVFVSASEHHFATQGGVYRRRVDGHDSLVAVGGLPTWTEGIVDTGCIATRGPEVAIADARGNLYVSADTGYSWSRRASELPAPSSVLIVGETRIDGPPPEGEHRLGQQNGRCLTGIEPERLPSR
jgi:hypothetical protein